MNILPRTNIRRLALAALAGALSLPAAQAEFTLVDDFQSYTPGNVRDVGFPWVAHAGTGFVGIAADGDNQFLVDGWATDFRSASRPLPAGTEINPGEQATVFFQFRAGPFGTAWTGGAQFGLASVPDTTQNAPFGAFRLQTTVNPNIELGINDFVVRDGTDFVTLTTLDDGSWYNIWYVIDRTDGDTFEIYLTAAADITPNAEHRLSYTNGEGATVSSFSFRSGGAPEDVLTSFMVIGQTDPDRSNRVDNIWIDNTGENFDFNGIDHQGWQQNFAAVEADPVFTADFGTGAGQTDELFLLRNRAQDMVLQPEAIRYEPTSAAFTSSIALAEVGNYLARQDFTVETEITLDKWLFAGGARAGLIVSGNHVAFDDPIKINLDREFYSLVWFPEITFDEVTGVSRSILQISEGLNGPVFATVDWEGLLPFSGGLNTATPFMMKAEGVYDDAGDLTLSLTLEDPNGHSQTLSAQIPLPYSGDFFGVAGRSQSFDDPAANPVFDFHNLTVSLGDEPGDIIPDPGLEVPFSLAFGSNEGLNAGDDFTLSSPADWSLQPEVWRLSASTADYQNSFATMRINNFSPGTDFFLRTKVTVPSLADDAAENRVGMVLFGDSDRNVFDPTDDATYLTLQWLPTSPAGGSLVVRQGMDGAEFARTDLAGLVEPPVFTAGGSYNLYFEGRYDAEGNLAFTGYLLDGNQNEAEVAGVIATPPTGNRFGLGARHRATENAAWDFQLLNWSSSAVLRGDITTIAAASPQNLEGGAANAIGKRRTSEPAEGEPDPAAPVFTWITNPYVGTNGGEVERQTNAMFLLFPLPERPTGASIRDANLSITRLARTRFPGEANVDVWGVGFQPDLALSSDFWHAGDTDEGAAAGIPAPVKLHDNLVTPAISTDQAVFTTEGVEFDLAEFLNHLYENGAQAGDYAMIRLSYDLRDLNQGVIRYEFSGPGTAGAPVLNLTMTPGTAPEGVVFADWQATEFPNPDDLANAGISGPLATPAGDGVTNLMKYANGIAPMTAVTASDLFLVNQTGGVLALTYTERTDVTDLNYIVEVSEDLLIWNTGSGFIDEIGRAAEGTTEAVSVEAVSTGADRLFMRVRVQLQAL